MAPLERWNDDRLDDLASTLHALVPQVSALQRAQDRAEADLKSLARTGDRREERTWTLKITVLGIAIGTLTNLIFNVVRGLH